ncbi:MAG: response regulator [Colwellia sp.]
MASVNYQNKRFLIVDNIKPSHDILKRFAMSISNQQVDSTLYAKDVISICLEKIYDVILLGYDLGDKQKNGQQLLEELRINKIISRHCVVIIITAELSQAMVLAALEHKPDDYLCKPYTIKELNKRLTTCLMKKKTMAPIYQAMEQGNSKITLALVNNAIAQNSPHRSECLGIKSRQFFELKQFDQARKIYLEYQHAKNCQWASIGLGKIALHENQLSFAEDIFKEIIAQHPLYLPSYDWLATTYQKQFNNLSAELTLKQALNLSPRSIIRSKRYAFLCFENENFENAAYAYEQTHKLANYSIHNSPENALQFARALVELTHEIPIDKAKILNGKAFSALSQMTRDFNQIALKIESHLLSACLLENIHEYTLAENKLNQGEALLEENRKEIEEINLVNISKYLTKLNKGHKASQILVAVNKQSANQEAKSTKVGELSDKSLNNKYKVLAQKSIKIGKILYSENKYLLAIEELNKAHIIFPEHIGIKLNLLQALLASYENDKEEIGNLKQAKILILNLLNFPIQNEYNEKLMKLKEKYQQVVGT